MEYPVHKYQVETTVTVRDVYGADDPLIPTGYKATGEFRPVVAGDTFLTTNRSVSTADYSFSTGHPRIILKRKRKVRQITFTEIDFGYPKSGQYFQSASDDSILLAKTTVEFRTMIFKREEKLVEKQDNDL